MSVPVIIVTNQSGINRGFRGMTFIVNERIQHLLDLLPPLSAIYANGHGPSASNQSWRNSPSYAVTSLQ